MIRAGLTVAAFIVAAGVIVLLPMIVIQLFCTLVPVGQFKALVAPICGALVCVLILMIPNPNPAQTKNTQIENTQQATEAVRQALRARANRVARDMARLPLRLRKWSKRLQLKDARALIDKGEFGAARYIIVQLERWLGIVLASGPH
jgi:hypothetical protein